jgi:hypothetical protein
VLNLELPGTKQNSFSVLNTIDDDVLIQNDKDLGVSLANDENGQKDVITAMKAEEVLRAQFVEAEYQAHLEKLNLKERVQDDDGLDLLVVDNSQRDLDIPSDPPKKPPAKTDRG